jgi:serine/threonine protein kinase
VKLADMGIAQLLSPEALTATLSVRGTAAYISPEQSRGDPVDPRADLYSLGCVLFEMLTGRTPFVGDLAALIYAHMHTAAPRVRSINHVIPTAMDELVAAMLEKDPARRPQTAEAVQGSLAAAIQQGALPPTVLIERVSPPPAPMLLASTGKPRRHGRRAWRTVIIAATGVAMLFLIALLASGRSDGRRSASAQQQGSTAPRTQQPSPSATSAAPTSSSSATQQPSPMETTTPAAAEPSPEEAAVLVLDTVGEGMETGEITGHLDHEIRHSIDEILREARKDEDLDEALDKVDELQEKVSEAFEKGEITSADRASAIREALLLFAEALRDAEH